MPGRKAARYPEPAPIEPLRLDKWLWAARFFKTRSLARLAIEGGHVRVNGVSAKPSRAARVGDRVELRRGDQALECTIQALSQQRGPASVAATLYEETPASVEARERANAERSDPAAALRPGGARPTKRQRRSLDRWRVGDTGPND